MKLKELKSLLARAAAALETPYDLTEVERTHVIEDLRVAEDETDIFLGEDPPDVLTKAQRDRWVHLQLELPGYEIERDPHAIGYWARQLGYAKPGEPGAELDGWLTAHSEMKEGVIQGCIAYPEPGPIPQIPGFQPPTEDEPGQMVGIWIPRRELTPLETDVLGVAIDHMIEHLEDLNQFESDSDELRARLAAVKTLKRDLWADMEVPSE